MLDVESDDRRLRLRSLHPEVTVDEVVAATGFDLVIPGEVAETRLPTPEDLELLDTVIDREGARFREVPG